MTSFLSTARSFSRPVLLAAAVGLLFVSAAASPMKKLAPGDKAPSLKEIEKWQQGQGPDLGGEGVTVVEFWATWCAPCKRAIPHINEMYSKLKRKGLNVCGIAADENGKDTSDNIRGVKAFLKSKGDGMSYNVAVDTTGEIKRNWMEAAGKEGIPCAFVVGRAGHILWIGNPLDELFPKVVTLSIMGKFDPIATPKAWDAMEAAKRAAALRNYREAYQIFDDAAKPDPALFDFVVLERYKTTLEKEGNTDAAAKYLRTMLPAFAGDRYSLDYFVNRICKDPEISKRDLDGAMLYAEALKKAMPGQPADGLAAIALVQATQGQYEKAVENQTAAWLAAPADDKADFKRVLEDYQAATQRKAQAAANAGN